MKNTLKQIAEGRDSIEVVRNLAREALAQPDQEPVAIHQFRSPHCADWYDGIPDHHDGHGPYEVRTLYTAPPQRKPLTDEHPLMVFAKECVLGAYKETELADAAQRAIKFAKGIKE